MNRLILSLLIALLGMATPLRAQLKPGEWRMHTAFQGGGTRAIIPVGDKLYIHSGISLFGYDSASDEAYSFSRDNVLTDIKVEDIHATEDGKYILVVYDNGNLDVLRTSDNTVRNQSALRDAHITGDREVRSVAFQGHTAYIGTDFGLMVLDLDTNHVRESGQYRSSGTGTKLPVGGPDHLCLVGDRLMGLWGSDLYESLPGDAATTYRTAEKFRYIGTLAGVTQLIAETDASMGVLCKEGNALKPARVAIPAKAQGGTVQKATLSFTATAEMWRDGGRLYAVGTDGVLRVLEGSSPKTMGTLPQEMRSMRAIGSDGDLRRLWVASIDGVRCCAVADGAVTLTFGPYFPQAPGVVNVSNLQVSRDGNRIYVSTRSPSHRMLTASGAMAEPLMKEKGVENLWGAYTPGFVDVIEDGEVKALPYSGVYNNAFDGAGMYETRECQNRYGDVIAGAAAFTENPLVPGQIWVPSYAEGLYRIDNGAVTGLFAGADTRKNDRNWKYKNMPINGFAMQRFTDVQFDSAGNMWVLSNSLEDTLDEEERNNAPGYQLLMLPARHTTLPMESLKREMWLGERPDGKPLIPQTVRLDFEGRLVHLKKSNVIFIMSNRYNGTSGLYRTGGTPEDFSDDSWVDLGTLTDQDGQTFSANQINAAIEDEAGRLVLGFQNGFCYISNPATFDPATHRVKRFKVPRNDGTGTADYLLDQVMISGMAFDGAGRLWVSTEGSGISVISPDYDAVLEQYTTDNSPLPTNNFSAIAVDPHSNRVWAGSTYGLAELASYQSPSMEDYKDVKAYPNPVRPDFYGQVTIEGLMDDSAVKIVNAAGAIVAMVRSTGGMARWDLRDTGGSPVKSGVYYIVPSQTTEGGDRGRVAGKILVIR